MIELIRNTSLPPAAFCNLAPENEIIIKKAVEFTRDFHPARVLFDSSGRLDEAAKTINGLIFPTCVDDEDFVELACVTADAVASWEDLVADERYRKTLGRALYYFGSQKPKRLERRMGQVGEHYAQFISGARYMLDELGLRVF